ncbi:MAG TPA: CHASE3 domain-containing protein, partial [Chthoniobacterales bacterium]|nr:CHASE3 domain-containing protein [Chthoniobacterales bacterium]
MTETDVPQKTKVRRNIVSRSAAWLFSARHFHFKLLSGTAVGIVVITFLAGLFLFVTLRNHHQETLRAHTLDVMRLSSVLENDIAALETGHRGYLLTGSAEYLEPFERRRELIKRRVEELTQLILDSPRQRKRVMKIQEIVQKWLDEVALPQINERQTKGTARLAESGEAYGLLGHGLLNQAREILQSLQNEEQIVLNQRMREQEWAAQSTQMLDFLTKLERSVIEMQKEKRG